MKWIQRDRQEGKRKKLDKGAGREEQGQMRIKAVGTEGK